MMVFHVPVVSKGRFITTTDTSRTTQMTGWKILMVVGLFLLLHQQQQQQQQHPLGYVESIRILPSEWMNTTARRRRRRRQLPLLQHERTVATTTSVSVTVPKSPDDHLVTSLPLLDDTSFTTKQWAGHLPVSDNGDKYFFYWLFAPDFESHSRIQVEKDAPIIVWLNGGPACSSMDGLFIENGPFQFNVDPQTGKYRLIPNPYSWHKAPAYTLYIDQPVGTGLSFTTSGLYPTNDHEVNVDFYYFLQQFFTLHRDKFVDATTGTGSTTNPVMNRKLFFSGESYAGHYIPSLMNHLLKKKENTKHNNPDEIQISVTGGAIGNGWTDPFYQYAGAEFAYGHAMIGMAQVRALDEKEKSCQANLNAGHYSVSVCYDLIDDILAASFGSGSMYKASGYDVRVAELRNGEREFPPGHKIIETYLGGWNTPTSAKGTISNTLYTKVLAAIHASAATAAGQVYQECTDPPYNALAGNDGKGVVDDVVAILQHSDKVQLLFFNGVHDIICNHVGNEKFLEKLPWDHASNWYKSNRYSWTAPTEAPGKVSGYIKEYLNLKFLKVMDAGHMVPMDVPNVALDMMKIFVANGNFNSNQQELDVKMEDGGTCPICPTCLERDSAVPGTADSAPANAVVISYTWLIFGSLILVMTGMLTLHWIRPRRSTLSTTTARHQPVPQYELELRDTKTSYHDNDIADENGIRNGTTNGGTII